MQTFTIIFAGLARSTHSKMVLGEAIKLYNVLLSDERLHANTIHLNAMLNICGRAGDIEAMFTIVDTINERTRVADAATYTTILNALRWQCITGSKGLTTEQNDQNIIKTIGRAKMLWREAISSWRRGRLIIDENMVCAFGRLLILTPDRFQRREVFDLFEQTMNIPNLTKEDNEGWSNDGTSLAEKGRYVRPDNNTLSLILTALPSVRLTRVGFKYWNHLVGEYRIVPDQDTWMRLFGLLKAASNSAHIAEMIDAVPEEHVLPRIYCMAFQGCLRNNMNINVIKNSNAIFDSMLRRLELPHPEAMRLYLHVALVTHYNFRQRANLSKAEAKAAILEYSQQLAAALKTLWEPYCKIYDHYFKEVKPIDADAEGVLYNNKREVIAVARGMISAIDKIPQHETLSEEEFDELSQMSIALSRQVHAFFSQRDKAEPNLPRYRNGQPRSTGAADDDGSGKGKEEREAEKQPPKKRGRFDEANPPNMAWDTKVALRDTKYVRDERRKRRRNKVKASKKSRDAAMRAETVAIARSYRKDGQ